MKRHSDAGVSPPTVLYVAHDCRRGIAMETKRLLSQWFEMEISIEIWHFMRCIAVGCTTVSTKVCYFPWTSFSLHLCMKPGRPKPVNTCHTLQSHKEWSQRSKWGGCHQKISKKSLPPIATGKPLVWKKPTYLIHDLIDTFQDEQGGDTLGVPLLNIWDSQNRHIACIQDPDEVQLYIKTGVVTKGGVELPLYRCTQGSTSLKSYHIYHNRFIPGICTCTVDVEIYFNYWMDINWLVITCFCFWNGSMDEKCCKWERADIDECPYC